ncbi:MAG TPA: hypothetical protein VIW03_02860 [Anaeromyxobacter sp.]
MEDATKRSGGARACGRPASKLFRILVAGGIALGAGCATTQGGGKPEKPDDGSASAPPPAQPAQPSGVRGW